MEKATQLAGLIGPVLIVLSISEAIHLHIWEKVEASLVYLNGLLLFVGGLALVRAYSHWAFDWTLLITLIGWFSLIAGLYRMFFPAAPQLKKKYSYLWGAPGFTGNRHYIELPRLFWLKRAHISNKHG